MNDGFVKEPSVATRENFDSANYSAEGLEKVKLEDGVRIHENTKVELEVYARNNDQPMVKPFMLVVAQDTTHANALQQVMENGDFFEGRYKGKVITVHSKVSGEEKDEVVEQLLTVERPDNPVEVVIHVNMLKEVTNLYTIVPCGLIDFNDISYDDHAALLYKLAGQVVAHLRSYLAEEKDVLNVLQYHQQPLVNLIHSQMQDHFVE